MSIIKKYSIENGTVVLTGKIDAYTSDELRSITNEISQHCNNLVLDFKDVIYISSAGLRELLVCRKRFRESMLVKNVSPDVAQIFEITGFNSLIPISMASEDSEEDISFQYFSFKRFLDHKVQVSGDRVVLADDTSKYTWIEIEQAAQILAIKLSKYNVTKGTHVGLCGLNDINWVLMFYAIQKLGAIACLINPRQSKDELKRICSIGDITCFCCGEIPGIEDKDSLLDSLIQDPDCPVTSVFPYEHNASIKEQFNEYDAIREMFTFKVDSDWPCVMIFTSGSTGRPKGVLLSAYNILNVAKVSAADQTLTNQDRNCQILPLFHIFGLVCGLFACNIKDTCIYFPADIRTGTLLNLIEKEQCTILHSVPTMILALINNKSFTSERCRSLRCSMIGGSAATEYQMELFREKMPQNHFMSAYGLSEIAPCSTTAYEDTVDHILHTVGKPCSFIQLKIQDPVTKKECAPGESGEILIQGINLMAGYYKADFDDQPIDEEGWLSTGDMGYIREDGYLSLSGRIKELIIRGGENIMPLEVETAISGLDIIDNVKVLGVPSDFFGEEVCACIVLKEGAVFDEDQIRQMLKPLLADYKIPSYFYVYDSLPLLGTGKIDGVSLKKDLEKRFSEKRNQED